MDDSWSGLHGDTKMKNLLVLNLVATFVAIGSNIFDFTYGLVGIGTVLVAWFGGMNLMFFIVDMIIKRGLIDEMRKEMKHGKRKNKI